MNMLPVKSGPDPDKAGEFVAFKDDLGCENEDNITSNFAFLHFLDFDSVSVMDDPSI